MTLKRRLTLLVSTLLTVISSAAQAQTKVFVSATADDPVGARLVYAIKEGIRRSASMDVVDRVDDGFIRVHVVTIDPDKTDGGGRRTVYSLVFTTQTLHDTPVTMYLNNLVGVCGANRVSQCADGLVADTDNQASMVRGWVKSIIERASQ